MSAKSLDLANRKKEIAAVLFLDLDGFKPINDNYGHEAGDWVLQKIAARLKRTLRKSDLLARYGGDEFVVLLQGIKSGDNLLRIVEKIRGEIEKNMVFKFKTLCVGASIGYAIFPEEGSRIEVLIEKADSAMYEEKKKRKKEKSE